MSKYCAKRVNSENRDLVKQVVSAVEAHPENIDFSGNRVDAGIFPVAELKEASREILRVMGPEALQYSGSHDYLPLKTILAGRYAKYGVAVAPEQFTITNGGVQAVDMLMKVLVNEGDTVLVESPLSWRLRQTMTMYRPDMVEIPLAADGIDLAALEEALKTTQPKFFYCSPNYQEPTGVVYSAENRAAIVKLMKEYDCILVEQDDYTEISEDGTRLPYMFPEMEGCSILLGSISQLVGPGLRIGWVICTHPVLLKYFTDAKQKTDSHANGLIQRVLWQYLNTTDINAQAAKVRNIYNEKRAAAVSAADQYLSGKASVNPVSGGTFLWVTPTVPADSVQLFEKAMATGVSIVPGRLFGSSSAGSVYLNYGGADTAQIEQGIKVLADLI